MDEPLAWRTPSLHPPRRLPVIVVVVRSRPVRSQTSPSPVSTTCAGKTPSGRCPRPLPPRPPSRPHRHRQHPGRSRRIPLCQQEKSNNKRISNWYYLTIKCWGVTKKSNGHHRWNPRWNNDILFWISEKFLVKQETNELLFRQEKTRKWHAQISANAIKIPTTDGNPLANNGNAQSASTIKSQCQVGKPVSAPPQKNYNQPSWDNLCARKELIQCCLWLFSDPDFFSSPTFFVHQEKRWGYHMRKDVGWKQLNILI